MHITFTEQEREYIDKKPFNWKVKADCPNELAKSIKEKLKEIYKSN